MRHYLQSSFFKFQWILQFVLLLVFLILPQGYNVDFLNICSVSLLIIIGIPHGANDLLYRKNKSIKGALIFLLIYLGSMFVYAGLWWVSPLLALILFLVISVHHFGQSNYENHKTFHIPSLLWGGWLLIAPVFIHFNESISIFAEMIKLESSTENWETVSWVVRYGILIAYLLIAINNYPKLWLFIVLQSLLIALWYEFTPLLSGFIIVFTVWHSSQSLFYQWKFYRNMERPKPSIQFFITNMFIFTCMAGLFLYLISIYFELNISMLFILLSIITLPHVIVMDGIYKVSKSVQ